MDFPERIDGPTPARQSPAPPPTAPAFEYDDDAADGAASQKNPWAAIVWRALRRHWWLALLLWAAGSAGLATLAYYQIKPTYEAMSQIRIVQGDPVLMSKTIGAANFPQYFQSQVTLITSPVVLSDALNTNTELLRYPRLGGALDAEAEIRKAVHVQIVRDTNQVQVSMTSESSQEAVDVVNAVVKAYMRYAEDTNDQETARRIKNLETVQATLDEDVQRKRDKLQKLNEELGDKTLKKEARSSLAQYQQLNSQLESTQIERASAQLRLEQLLGERSRVAVVPDRDQINAVARDVFEAHPQVIPVTERLNAAQRRLREAERKVRDKSDPAYKHRLEEVAEHRNERARLWRLLWPKIKENLTKAPTDELADREVRAAELRFKELEVKEKLLRARLEEIGLKNEGVGGEPFRIKCAESDLSTAEAVLKEVQVHLKGLEFEAKGTIARVYQEFAARPSNKPSANNRVKVIAVVPFAVWFAVMGLLALVELRSGRVADPAELTSRMRLTILGVVPPLPPVRSAALAGRGELRSQRRLEEFVQSLDHLRVALCARPDPWGRDRHCVLITSACGSEGKTTLAAQLAERCVNAGLLTLLVDADLRNPTLSRMLGAEEQLGLINVLRDEVSAEAAMTVVHDAGGFHFLSAGWPRVDPSRLLQGDRLGHLLAQARESFDMIIVDAPPVLPVPDALTIGRWTDGAVLAVRYDASRLPLVDRANRRLAHVGVPVLGAVVSGVRSNESSYGGYYAYGGSSPTVGSA